LLSAQILTEEQIDDTIASICGKPNPKSISFDEFKRLVEMIDQMADQVLLTDVTITTAGNIQFAVYMVQAI
jgi:hypothetical protein